jgi:hypothetical protein
MMPYLLEGLDCSGKKTTAALVAARLRAQGIASRVVIGPLSGGIVAKVDAVLTKSPATRKSAAGLSRRFVYVIGPVLDRFRVVPSEDMVTLKVSSHFRAWARALVEKDRPMALAYRMSAGLHVSFSGATLLSASFCARVARHRADVEAGRPAKPEFIRFVGMDEQLFTDWDVRLTDLVMAHIPRVQRLDTSIEPPERIAERVVEHLLIARGNSRVD